MTRSERSRIPMTPFPFLLSLILLFGCKGMKEDPSKKDPRLTVTCTTSMIRDAAEVITGNKAEVIPIMGAGVDPHVYKATQGDLKKLRKADLIFYNGLRLEGKMGTILQKLDDRKPVIPIAERLDEGSLLSSEDYPDAYDPHIWFNVQLWKRALGSMVKHLTEKDPEHAAFYRKNAQSYFHRLDTLHHWVRKRIQEIPDKQRLLITAHDAFSYFGDAYGMEVRGLQGLSTATEYGLRDIKKLVDLIVKRRIQAVFIESSVPSRPMKAVIKGAKERGHEVTLGGTLYSDALGEKGTPEGTYIGTVKHNVNTIVTGLTRKRPNKKASDGERATPG